MARDESGSADPGAEARVAGDRSAEPGRSLLRTILEWIGVAVAALLIATFLRTYVVQTFWIPTGSMIPTLQENDRVVVNKLSYRLHGVDRGDIIVFTTPPGVPEDYKDLVKRVIGLPGDTVEGLNGRVLVNGKVLDESYLPEGTSTSQFGPKIIPPNSFWVMGDNRSNSTDSRSFGPIPKRSIVGHAVLRIWPLRRFGLL
ncbi:MAG: signal peptidase I [Actinomycetota bacterium]